MPEITLHPVGFVGIGKMGAPMVAHLAASGFATRVHDADPEHAHAAARGHAGVTVARALREFAGAPLVVCMLPNSAIVEQVLAGPEGLFAVLEPGATIVDMGSSNPSSTRALAAQAAAHGLELVDAPVSGGVARAVNGELTIMFGGSAEALERCRPVLETLGSTIIPVGEVGAGHAMKALNNLLSAIGLTASCEIIEAGRRFGLDPHVMLDVLNRSTGGNHATANKVEQFVLSETFASGFALRLMLKDIGIALALAEEGGVAAPLGHACQELWSQAADVLPADADQTMIATLVR